MKVFLDINVIFDFLLDSRDAFHEPAVELMRLVATDRLEAGFASSQAIDLYYILRNVSDDTAALFTLRSLFTLCELYPIPAAACIDALDFSLPDYESAVQIETARANGCSYIIRSELPNFEDSSVPFLTPTQLLELF